MRAIKIAALHHRLIPASTRAVRSLTHTESPENGHLPKQFTRTDAVAPKIRVQSVKERPGNEAQAISV